MEAEDWYVVIANNIINHFRDEDAVAKAISIAMLGDEKEWRGHRSHAKRFLDAMEKSMPKPMGLAA